MDEKGRLTNSNHNSPKTDPPRYVDTSKRETSKNPEFKKSELTADHTTPFLGNDRRKSIDDTCKLKGSSNSLHKPKLKSYDNSLDRFLNSKNCVKISNFIQKYQTDLQGVPSNVNFLIVGSICPPKSGRRLIFKLDHSLVCL